MRYHFKYNVLLTQIQNRRSSANFADDLLTVAADKAFHNWHPTFEFYHPMSNY